MTNDGVTLRDGMGASALRCECGQLLCPELDVRTDGDGNNLAVCPNCGNCARLDEQEEEPFAAILERYRRAQLRHLEFLRQQGIAPGGPGKFEQRS
jgi:hypothetical protein